MNVRSSKNTATGNDGFPATRWTLILQARDVGDPGAPSAIAELCRIYWRPVYSFLRRLGNSAHDAEDLTQGFFASLLERGSFAAVDEAKGRMRSFLLISAKRFVATQYGREHAQKRGGNAAHVSLDMPDAEAHYSTELATDVPPELLFDRQWALTLLDGVMAKLRAAYVQDGREAMFDALKDRITGDGSPDMIAEVARRLEMTDGAIRTAIYRLRRRYSKVLHDQIALTVESPEEVRDEIAYLMRVFSATQ